MQNSRRLVRVALSIVFAAAFALAVSGCASLERLAAIAIATSAAPGGAWGYNQGPFAGGRHWGGGVYGGVNVPAGYYNQNAALFQPPMVMGAGGQQVVVANGMGGVQPGFNGAVMPQPAFTGGYGAGGFVPNGGQGGTITSGPTLFLQNGQIVTRSACDQAGCEMVLPGAPGPQVVPPQGTYRGIGSVQAVQFGPNGAVSRFIPRAN